MSVFGGLGTLSSILLEESIYYTDCYAIDLNIHIFLNGTIVENYEYYLNSPQFHTFSRNFIDPIVFESGSNPSVELLKITGPTECFPYFVSNNGTLVTGITGGDEYSKPYLLHQFTGLNEVGFFDPKILGSGKYSIRYVYRLNSTLLSDAESVYLPIRILASDLYNCPITIYFEDSVAVDDILTHPATFTKSIDEGRLKLTGNSVRYEETSFGLILFSYVMDVLPSISDSVDSLSHLKNEYIVYANQFELAYQIQKALQILPLLFPLFYLGFYYFTGREESVRLPYSVGYVPDLAIKPWFVNLLFKGDAMNYDFDGFMSTIIDLSRRKVLDINAEDEIINISVIHKNVDDGYEHRILNFIESVSINGTLNDNAVNHFLLSLRMKGHLESIALNIRYNLFALTKRFDANVSLNYVFDGRKKLSLISLSILGLFVMSLVLFFVRPGGYYVIDTSLQLFLVVFLQSLIPLNTKSTLFGRWKKGLYAQKLRWDAFADNISQYLKKGYARYSDSDWLNYLVYGTAMGVGFDVLVWGERLGINLKEFTYYRILYSIFDSLANRYVFTLPLINNDVLDQLALFSSRNRLEKYVEKYEEETRD